MKAIIYEHYTNRVIGNFEFDSLEEFAAIDEPIGTYVDSEDVSCCEGPSCGKMYLTNEAVEGFYCSDYCYEGAREELGLSWNFNRQEW